MGRFSNGWRGVVAASLLILAMLPFWPLLIFHATLLAIAWGCQQLVDLYDSTLDKWTWGDRIDKFYDRLSWRLARWAKGKRT